MAPHHRLALIIAAAVAIPLVVFVSLQLFGINVDPLIIVGALVFLWAFGTGAKATGTKASTGSDARDAEAERRALAALQKKHTDEVIEEYQAGRISAERRNEQLRHILNAPPPSEPKGPGPRRPS